jgi:hypothetical protein
MPLDSNQSYFRDMAISTHTNIIWDAFPLAETMDLHLLERELGPCKNTRPLDYSTVNVNMTPASDTHACDKTIASPPQFCRVRKAEWFEEDRYEQRSFPVFQHL